MGRNALDGYLGDEIVFIGVVTNSPQNMRSCGLRLGFDPHFGRPLRTVLVADVKFWVRACVVFLYERQHAVRLVLLSAGAVKEIALGEISGFAPDGGIFLSFGHHVWRCRQE